MSRSGIAAIAALAALCVRANAQVLTLGDAIHRASRSAYPVRIAGGDATATGGQAVSALRGILPTVRFEGSYLRTTDPLNAFGFTLRQRAVSLASFEPAALNRPDAIGNLASGVVLELPLFNADAWLGRKAAVDASSAGASALTWSRESAAYDVACAYYGALLASERVTTLEASLAAAREHVRQAESLLRNGTVTRSDALIADVRAGEIEAMLIGARSEAWLARRRLALAMGEPADTAWILPAALPAATAVREIAARVGGDSTAPAERADVRAAGYANAAAQVDLQRARSLYLPRVNTFGRLDWNTPTAPFGGADSWTIGVVVSWVPFAGASQIGEIQAARGRKDAAAAAAEAAGARAQLELQQADAALQVALARLIIAERAVDQSAEAHRIVSRKYVGGLATVVELSDAAAIETQSRLGYAEGRFQAITAVAGRLRALGVGLEPITALDR